MTKDLGFAKIEVDKKDDTYFFTGDLSVFDEDHYLIETYKGEEILFSKDQVVQIDRDVQRRDYDGPGEKDVHT